MDHKTDKPKPDQQSPNNPTHFGGANEEIGRDDSPPAAEYQPFIMLGFDETGAPIVNFGDVELDHIELLLAQAKVDFISYRNAVVQDALMAQMEPTEEPVSTDA